jgi:hypothetical protein
MKRRDRREECRIPRKDQTDSLAVFFLDPDLEFVGFDRWKGIQHIFLDSHQLLFLHHHRRRHHSHKSTSSDPKQELRQGGTKSKKQTRKKEERTMQQGKKRVSETEREPDRKLVLLLWSFRNDGRHLNGAQARRSHMPHTPVAIEKCEGHKHDDAKGEGDRRPYRHAAASSSSSSLAPLHFFRSRAQECRIPPLLILFLQAASSSQISPLCKLIVQQKKKDAASNFMLRPEENNKLSLLMYKHHHQTTSCSQLKHHNNNNNKNKNKAITAKGNPTQQICCYEKEKMDCKALDLRSLRAELSFCFS